MKRLFLILNTLLMLSDCYGQMTSDSLGWPVIKGDIILYGNSNIALAKRDGYELSDFYMLSCDSGERMINKNKISSIENIDSTLIIKVSIENNCCKNILASIKIEEDSIINILYHDYGSPCLCDCNFCLTYEINYSIDRIKKVSRWTSRNKFVKYLMFDGDRKTLVNIEHLLHN